MRARVSWRRCGCVCIDLLCINSHCELGDYVYGRIPYLGTALSEAVYRCCKHGTVPSVCRLFLACGDYGTGSINR